GEYLFVDQWDVAAPPEAVFELLADARTYPDWWRPVYIAAESDGPPELGRESRQHFKGRLPYTLRTRSTITVYEPPELLGADVVEPGTTPATGSGMRDEAAELYGLPLAEFTSARNEVARRLKAEGDDAAAEEVRSLRKPTVPVWAINRLARTEPAAVRGLLDA